MVQDIHREESFQEEAKRHSHPTRNTLVSLALPLDPPPTSISAAKLAELRSGSTQDLAARQLDWQLLNRPLRTRRPVPIGSDLFAALPFLVPRCEDICQLPIDPKRTERHTSFSPPADGPTRILAADCIRPLLWSGVVPYTPSGFHLIYDRVPSSHIAVGPIRGHIVFFITHRHSDRRPLGGGPFCDAAESTALPHETRENKHRRGRKITRARPVAERDAWWMRSE
jgi:hypothetical protein